MTAYLINVFDNETHHLVDTIVFLSWREAQKYFNENIPMWNRLNCYANLGGEHVYFKCPKKEK